MTHQNRANGDRVGQHTEIHLYMGTSNWMNTIPECTRGLILYMTTDINGGILFLNAYLSCPEWNKFQIPNILRIRRVVLHLLEPVPVIGKYRVFIRYENTFHSTLIHACKLDTSLDFFISLMTTTSKMYLRSNVHGDWNCIKINAVLC